MTERARTWRVLMALVASMTIGAVVLMALDRQSLSAGAFSLASYISLNPVEQVLSKPVAADRLNWGRVEVVCSKDLIPSGGGLFTGPAWTEPAFHFIISNGKGGADGFIQATAKWLNQQSCLTAGTVRIAVITESPGDICTDIQVKRTTALVEAVSRQFNINSSSIRFPAGWNL